MRMLFKRAIPWSDRVYNAFSHVKSPLCCTHRTKTGQSQSVPQTPRGPYPLAGRRTTRSRFSSRWPERAVWILLNLEECLHRDISLKNQNYFFLAVKTQPIYTICFDAHRTAKIALLIVLLFTNRNDTLIILQCFCFIEQNRTWKWYLPFELFCSTWKMNQ